MAKAPPRKPTSAGKGGGKERVTPPKKPLLTREARNLRKGGDPAAGRIVSEEAQAVRQGVRKPAAPKGKGKGR